MIVDVQRVARRTNLDRVIDRRIETAGEPHGRRAVRGDIHFLLLDAPSVDQ